MSPDQLHTARPSVYLDQWVWVELARAAAGRPSRPSHVAALAALQAAASEGVAFPLSATHYMETVPIKKVHQRRDLANVMSSISFFRTLRGGREPMRHQFLTAMHESFQRPTFRPTKPEALGLGVSWAFEGVAKHLRVLDRGNDRAPADDVDRHLPALLRQVNQVAERQLIAGPADDEVEALREYGYQPETAKASSQSRLEWEEVYKDILKGDPIDRDELRVRVQARELLHEHFDLFQEVMAEYRLTAARAFHLRVDGSGPSREKIVAFSDRVPSMRIAVDMKTALFRDATYSWKVNDLHDIDALSRAIPYCHVVVADRAAVDRIKRTGADSRHGTAVVRTLDELVELLPPLVSKARELGGDTTGWDTVGPGAGFVPIEDGLEEVVARWRRSSL